MASVDVRALSQPVGIMRIMATFLSCMSFSLVASAGYFNSPYWAWCMFTWCFCFFFTLLILILEFTTIFSKLPFPWEDFTTAFAMLASLMCLAASIIYPIFFTCSTCHRQIGASVVSWVCFGVYTGEVVLTRLRPSGEHIGFLSTLPGIMKMLETFLSCLIFTSLEVGQYSGSPGLQWCIAVFSLCFIFNVLIILLTVTQLISPILLSFEKLVILYNLLAALMYLTAMVIWPLYSFETKRPGNCGSLCSWDKLVMVTLMTIFNAIVYTLDAAYSIRLVFCVSNQ
ncbi:myeloid-associated differentiation marker-like [Xyrichtys novacula]|uniref:Myeloid-associated differentiation marker-like n=1 Tax=Xyrichtys novacula TaxID=13765 RepID=A0AAV1GU44_XYRNO|nr:myeloid-associated differentiation marker-like [Xyrichtys novacula]